jgi:hypothetical protein
MVIDTVPAIPVEEAIDDVLRVEMPLDGCDDGREPGALCGVALGAMAILDGKSFVTIRAGGMLSTHANSLLGQMSLAAFLYRIDAG